jgi:anti-anti-sigma regulatory factor
MMNTKKIEENTIIPVEGKLSADLFKQFKKRLEMISLTPTEEKKIQKEQFNKVIVSIQPSCKSSRGALKSSL